MKRMEQRDERIPGNGSRGFAPGDPQDVASAAGVGRLR